METETLDKKEYIYILYAENEGGFSQPYSTEEETRKASRILGKLRPEWNLLIHKRKIDDTEFWEKGYSGGEYANPLKRITRCFDKEFILLIYFSLLAFLWFKL